MVAHLISEVVLVKIVISVAKFIILIAVLVALIGIAMYFSGYTMYAKVGENTIFDVGSGYTVSSTTPLRVDLGYTFDFGGEKDMSGYSVMVVPNTIAGKDFTYKLGEMEKSFQAIPDLTKGFVIEKNDSFFTIKSVGCLDMILGKVHQEELQQDGLSISHHHGSNYENMYTIVIYSNDGESSVKIHFSNEDDNHWLENPPQIDNGDGNSGNNGLNNDNEQNQPSKITVDISNYKTNQNGFVMLHPNNTYTFEIVSDGNGNAEYGISTGAYGTVILGNCEFFMGDMKFTYDNSTLKTVDYSSLLDELVEVSLDGKYITVTTKGPIETYYKDNSSTDGVHIQFVDRFYSYGSDCFFKIAVRDAERNLETVFGITIVNKAG